MRLHKANIFAATALCVVTATPMTAVAQESADDVVLPTVTVTSDQAKEKANGPVEGYVAHQTATGTKTSTPLIENPQSMTVVGRQQMEDQGARTIAEALRYEPGVLSESRTGDRFDNVFMRGFGGFGNNANYLQFWDGLRLPRGANYANPSVEQYLVDRIDIMRGPASILYGQNNPGGLINLVSKNPTETPFHEVFTQFSSHNRIEAGFDLSGPLTNDKTLLYRLIALGYRGDTEVNYNKTERELIAPSFTWRPQPGTSLTVRAIYQHDPFSYQQNWLPANGTLQQNPNGQIPRDFFSGHPNFNTYDRKQSSIGYEFAHEIDNTWTVRQNLRYMHIDSTFKAVSVSSNTSTAPSGYVSAASCGGVSNLCLYRTSSYYVEELDALTLDNQAQATFATGDFKHTTLFGLDYQWSSANSLYNSGGSVSNVNYLNPNYGTITEPTLRYSTDQTRKQLGIYAQDQIRWGNWAFVIGVRHDDSDQSTATRTISSGALSSVASPSDSAWTWRAGATYLFDNGLAPYLSYSTSFEPTLGTDYAGNAFVPTTGKQFEGGIKYQPTRFNGYFLVSGFDIRQQNVLMQDSAHTSNSLCTASSGYCQMQTGEVRSTGVEVSGKTTPIAGLDIVAAYSYTNIRITESQQVTSGVPLVGKVPVGAPANQASLWGDYTIQAGSFAGLGFGGGVRYVGRSYGDNINSDAMIVPAYTLLDLAAHYDFGMATPQLKGWKMALNVSNVFDKTYVSACASSLQCFYGTGRVITGTLRYRW